MSEVDRLEGKRKSAPRWAESFEKENPGFPLRRNPALNSDYVF